MDVLGEICVANSRVFVQEDIYDKVVEKVKIGPLVTLLIPLLDKDLK